jgi:DNA-binding GntR family transcriptional regulator
MNQVLANITPLPRSEGMPVNEWVYGALRRAVMCGQISPGVSLTIRGLAEVLNVSPMPVREALRRLASERALEIRENRRVVVPEMTSMKFYELSQARMCLESHAAESALPYITSQRIDELYQLDKDIDAAYECNDKEGASLANQAFHQHIYTANPHQVMMPLIESIWLQLGPFVRIAGPTLKEHYSVDRHEEAIEAMRRQDAFALGRAIRSDIQDGIMAIEASGNLGQYFAEKAG